MLLLNQVTFARNQNKNTIYMDFPVVHGSFGAVIANEFTFPNFRRYLTKLHDYFIPHERNLYHPHILGHRLMGLVSLFLVTLKLFTLTLFIAGPIVPALSSAITEQNVLTLTNLARTDYQLKPLRESSVLDKAAQAKAEDMLARQYFSHNTPDGKTPWDFLDKVNYDYDVAGENLAVDFSEAENVQDAWMNSPGHKANILHKDFTELGVGIARGYFQGHDTTVVVQMFGRPRNESMIAAAQVPVPAAASASDFQVVKTVMVDSKVLGDVSQPAYSVEVVNAQFLKDQLLVTAKSTGNIVRVLLTYGDQSFPLVPLTGDQWQASVPLSEFNRSQLLQLKATTTNGDVVMAPVSLVSDGLVSSFGLRPNTADAQVKIMGFQFSPEQYENKIYLSVIAVILTSLLIAVAVRRHVQHVGMIANAAFTAMLAAIMLMV